MHRRTSIQFLAAIALALTTVPAGADDIGSTGFSVPQPQQNEWLWGVEGLVRTPFDVSANFGAMAMGYEMNARVTHDDTNDGTGIAAVSDTLDLEPEGIQGGLRFTGLIGYWNCCVLIEPAVLVSWNRPLGDERTDNSPSVFDPSDADEFAFADVDYMGGWDVAVGPQMTWMLPDSTPLIGGLPLVFFPYLGVTHSDYDVEFVFMDDGTGSGNIDRNFEDDNFMIGFDLDIPLPGSHWNFTHALTFGFRWNDGSDSDHDFGGFNPDTGAAAPPPAFINVGGRRLADQCNGNFGQDQVCFNLDAAKGWRIGLSYRVTWNDFGGFFRRVVFGPVN